MEQLMANFQRLQGATQSLDTWNESQQSGINDTLKLHAEGLKKRTRDRVESWKRKLDEALKKAEDDIDRKLDVLQ